MIYIEVFTKKNRKIRDMMYKMHYIAKQEQGSI